MCYFCETSTSGYSDKLTAFTKFAVEQVTTYATPAHVFSRQKTELIRNLKNIRKSEARSICDYELDRVLIPTFSHYDEQLQVCLCMM